MVNRELGGNPDDFLGMGILRKVAEEKEIQEMSLRGRFARQLKVACGCSPAGPDEVTDPAIRSSVQVLQSCVIPVNRAA
jgi:hypothetical protein